MPPESAGPHGPAGNVPEDLKPASASANPPPSTKGCATRDEITAQVLDDCRLMMRFALAEGFKVDQPVADRFDKAACPADGVPSKPALGELAWVHGELQTLIAP